MTPRQLQKPLLRGVSHQLAAFVAAPAAVALWASADSVVGRFGAAIYGASLFSLFTISAIYHRKHWPPRARDLVGRIDHATIFLLIAGTYTPFGLLLWPRGRALLLVMWTGAACGVVISLVWPKAPKTLMATLYVLFGWFFVARAPSILQAAGPLVLLLLVLGGLIYTSGAIIYALQRPNPFPQTFGYHEIFHLFVVAAASIHFIAVSVTLPSIA